MLYVSYCYLVFVYWCEATALIILLSATSRHQNTRYTPYQFPQWLTPYNATSTVYPFPPRKTAPLTWQESWARLQVALQTYGIAHILDAPEELDPITAKCIRFICADDATLLTDTPEARSYYKRVFVAFRRSDELAQHPYTPSTATTDD